MLCAGPIFVLPIFLAVLIEHGFGSITGTAIMVAMSIPGGAILGAAPIIGGGYVMATLGERWRMSRHPGVWSVAGALLGTAVQWPLLLFAFDWQTTALFSITGAICALIVRYGARWSDDSA